MLINPIEPLDLPQQSDYLNLICPQLISGKDFKRKSEIGQIETLKLKPEQTLQSQLDDLKFQGNKGNFCQNKTDEPSLKIRNSGKTCVLRVISNWNGNLNNQVIG